ncbi:protein RTA1 [Trichoderma asperellum]|uniref:Protein RTA1 n=1 Tax=Trichoderma asperellum TaxID=101201 RepID=A0A6V8R1T3_TRIAP|nr:protein RTA1 [Trichoderma asperellum]
MANNNTETKGYAPFDLYPYNPSQGPAFAFFGLFSVVCLLHLVAMIPYRSFFPLPLVIGCGMEASAYWFRSQSHNDVRKTLPFLLQNLLLLSAPPFLAASIYMSPRRIARVLEAEHLTIRPRVLTKLFVLVDTVCFVTQFAGSIISGSENADEASHGRIIILAGLSLQIAAFGFFAVWTSCFQRRLVSASFPCPLSSELPWQRYIYGLYAISVLFIVRNITRMIEFQQGSNGEILAHEAYLYVLDSSVMLAIVTIFLILHPGRLRWMAQYLGKSLALGEEHIPLA